MSERLDRANSTDLSDHALWEYELILGINTKQFGKVVLDLGCGLSGKFGRELHLARPDISIISLSPQLSIDGRHDRPKILGNVAGLAQHLPLFDNSVDTIVGLVSVPCFVPAEDLRQTFDEILRVLRPGGEARLWPAVVFGPADHVVFDTRAEELMASEELPDYLLNSDVFSHPEFSSRIVIAKPSN